MRIVAPRPRPRCLRPPSRPPLPPSWSPGPHREKHRPELGRTVFLPWFTPSYDSVLSSSTAAAFPCALFESMRGPQDLRWQAQGSASLAVRQGARVRHTIFADLYQGETEESAGDSALRGEVGIPACESRKRGHFGSSLAARRAFI